MTRRDPRRLRLTGRVVIPLVGSLATGVALAAPSSAAVASAPLVCAGVTAPTVSSAVPDTQLDSTFVNYADDHTSIDDWTGADSTYSAPLPGGQDVWIYSDSFLGTVNADGSRSPVIQDGGTTPFINNSFVVTGNGALHRSPRASENPKVATTGITTVTGGTAADPTALMPPPDADHWYWARDGMVLNGKLDVIYSEFQTTGTGVFDFAWYRNVLAQFSLSNLSTPTSVTALPSNDDVSWGAWLMQDGGYTYIYGTEDLGSVKYLHLARVSGQDLTQPWQYLTSSGTWSTTETDSVRLSTDASASISVSNEMSVVKHGNVYVLVTQDMSAPLSANIDLAYSCSPTGPFVDESTAYTTPETGADGTYADANVYTYNPHEHPELDSGNKLVISYNVNSFVNTDLYSNASIYRARFITVTLSP